MKGDNDFEKVVGTIYTLRNETIIGLYRDKMKEELIKLKRIRPNTFFDPENPRLRIVSSLFFL